MRAGDAVRLVALVQKRWPATLLNEPQAEQYVRDIADLDADEARAAVDALHREGKEFMPPSGTVRRRVAEMQVDAPAWGEVRRQLNERSRPRGPREPWVCPEHLCEGNGLVDAGESAVADCPCRPAMLAARRRADVLHPLVREWVDGGHVTWGDLDALTDPDTRNRATLEAQLRDRWTSFARRAVDSRALIGVGGDLPRLAAAQREDRRRVPRRMDDAVRALLPPGQD